MWAEAKFELQIEKGKDKFFELINNDVSNVFFKSSNDYFKFAKMTVLDFRTGFLNVEIPRCYVDDGYFFGGLTSLYSSDESKLFELVEQETDKRTGIFCKIQSLKGRTCCYETEIEFEWRAARDGNPHYFGRRVL